MAKKEKDLSWLSDEEEITQEVIDCNGTPLEN